MGTTDLVVALLFILVVFAAGMAFAKVSGEGDSKGFFSGGGVVPWWVSGISLYMSFFSAGTFVVWGSIAYSDGFVAIGIQSMMCLAGVIIGLFIAARWNRTNVMTAAQFIGDRLGPKTRTTYTTLFLVTSLAGIGTLLYPIALMINVTTGIGVLPAILGLALFIIIYAAVGGLWAVLVTDLLQFVVLSASILLIVPLALAQVGGLDGFVEAAPENFFKLTNSEYTWGFLLAFLIYNTVFIGGQWGFVQRYTTVPSPRDAKKVAWLFAALYSFSPLIWMLPPMIFQVMEPGLVGSESERAYIMISESVLPAGLLGLMLCAMIFATASSVNTILNISAAVFTNDVWARIDKNASEHKLLNVGRISTAAFGLITILSALVVWQVGDTVGFVLSVAAIVGGSLFLPPLWSLFSKRQTAFSILTVTIVTLTMNLLFKFVTPDLIGFALSRSQEMLVSVFLPLTLLTLFEIAYASKGGEDPRMAYYRQRAAELKQEREELMAASLEHKVDERSNDIIAASIMAVGLIIGGLAFVAQSAALILAIAGLVIMGGGAMISAKVRRKVLPG